MADFPCDQECGGVLRQHSCECAADPGTIAASGRAICVYHAAMLRPDPSVPLFAAPYAPDDGEIAARLLSFPPLTAEQNARIDRTATRLIEAVRAEDGGFGGVEDMLREFALSTKEGLALMVMAEALLRVPDAATADRFIEDKLGQGDFAITRPGPTHYWSTHRHGRLVSPRGSSSRVKPRTAPSA